MSVPMWLPSISSPVAPATSPTPAPLLPEMMLRAPAAVPPIVTLGRIADDHAERRVAHARWPPCSRCRRSCPGPRCRSMSIPGSTRPHCKFAEITLPAPCAVPPIVVPGAPLTDDPVAGIAQRLGSGLVQRRRNCPGSMCWSPRSRDRRRRPRSPEMMLRARIVVPPIVVPEAPETETPAERLPILERAVHIGADQVPGHDGGGCCRAADHDAFRVPRDQVA